MICSVEWVKRHDPFSIGRHQSTVKSISYSTNWQRWISEMGSISRQLMASPRQIIHRHQSNLTETARLKQTRLELTVEMNQWPMLIWINMNLCNFKVYLQPSEGSARLFSFGRRPLLVRMSDPSGQRKAYNQTRLIHAGKSTINQ